MHCAKAANYILYIHHPDTAIEVKHNTTPANTSKNSQKNDSTPRPTWQIVLLTILTSGQKEKHNVACHKVEARQRHQSPGQPKPNAERMAST